MNISILKKNAYSRIQQAGDKPYRLTFLSTAVALGASLATAGIGALVGSYQGGGGLSGMGTAAFLQTLETCFTLAVQLASPFWAVGLVTALFAFANGQEADNSTLLAGFRRFGPFLRLYLLRFGIALFLMLILLMPASLVFELTPWGRKMAELAQVNPNILDDPAAVGQVMDLVLPMVVIYLVMVVVVYLPVYYRQRMADYYLIAGWRGALLAMVASTKQTRGKIKDLVKLDLSFWWYYLASALLMGVLFLDMIADLLGWKLPVGGQTAYWLCYGAYALGTLLLETFARPGVEAAKVFYFRSVAYDV